MTGRRGFLVLIITALATCVFAKIVDSSSKSDGQLDLLRDKRAVPAQVGQASSQKFQACIAPGNKPGHCKHLSSCGDETYRQNFPRMLDYVCVIDQQFVGVCCADDAPDNTLVDVPPAGGLAGSLPAVATEGPDVITMTGQDTDDRMVRRSRGCGISAQDQNRVIGGKPTRTRGWPWVAALIRDGDTKCGGVLITDRHVLTAAHCIWRYKSKDFRVRLGEYDLRFPNETRALDFRVVDFRIHPDYSPSTLDNDIAILKIHRPTIFNTYIWPICLPPVGAIFENKQATVVGWGMTEFAGAGSYVLMEVTVPVWPYEKCAVKYVQEITTKHLCAGAYEGNGDSCQGDSGGPLMIQLNNGRWVNIGIVSWGIGCGNPDQPGIYTKVNAYLDWIFTNTIF
ncbi:venom protease-like [Phymastichus coffea]|uniref:venom protease-like n=1 Tax=Phymastichus coffea TaxID=108790 RepID=UPI00273CA552|nr:venom protease-like [Phymastichus coffea]